MNDVLAITVMTVSGAFVVGLVRALLGVIKLNLARQLRLGDRGVNGLFAGLNLALIPSMLASGVLIDRFGVRWVLLAGSLLTALAVSALSGTPPYRRAYVAFLLVGLGASAVSTSCVVLIPHAFFVPDDPRASLVLKLNLGYVFIALGALLTLALVDVLFRVVHYRGTLLLLTGLCLVPAILCLVPDLVRTLPAGHDQSHDQMFATVTGNLTPLILAGLVFFCYAPLEGAVGVWRTTHLAAASKGRPPSNWILTAFWIAFLSSQLFVSWCLYLQHVDQVWPFLLVLCAVLGTVALGNHLGTANRVSARLSLLLTGFFLGPIFPTLLGLLLRSHEVPEHLRGTTYGLLFACGSLGSLLLAPFVSGRAEDDALYRARVPLLLALTMTLLSIGFVVAVGTP